MPQSGFGQFTYMSRLRGPQAQVSCEQFAQCQLQMLVLDVDICDLILYSLGSSNVFRIRRDNKWLAMALEILAHINSTYIQPGKQPKADALMDDKAALHKSFMATTKAAMHRLARQPALEVKSSLNQAALQPCFLDGAAPQDKSRQYVGKHEHSPGMVPCCHRSTAAEGSKQAKAQDRQHLACKQAFAAALCEEQAGHCSRKAYHPWMQTSYDLEMMKAMGVSEAKPCSGPSRWSDAEVTAMLECLRGLATREEGIHTKSPFYFVSHHSLLRMKSPDQVKALLSYVDRHYSAP